MRMRAPPPFSLVKLVVRTCPDQLCLQADRQHRCVSSRRHGHEHMQWAYDPIPPTRDPPALTFGDCGGAYTVQLCLLRHRLMSIEKDWHARMSPPRLVLSYLPAQTSFVRLSTD